MIELESFRTETRKWLEAQLPTRDAPAAQVGRRCLLGRPQLDLPVRRSAPMARADGRARLDRSRMAERIWGRRAVAGRSARPQQEMAAHRCAPATDQLRHLDARAGPAQVRHRRAEEAIISPRSRAARSAGARAIRSRAPARTSPGCRPGRRTGATTGWSTARRSGPATPTRPTGSSAWCAPPPSPSRAASASCCSTWQRPASRPSRSC